MFRVTFIYLIIVTTVLLITNIVFAGEVTGSSGDDYRDGLIEHVTVGSQEVLSVVPPINVQDEELSEPHVASDQVIKNLINFAKENEKCLSSNIPGRGAVKNAPGAFYGLTVTMARSVCRNAQDPIKKAMMNGRENTNDVFRYYGLDHSDEKRTMVNLYGLLLSHIHMESSGKFWEGVDVTNQSSFRSNTAEAGLCQTSNNINSTTSLIGREGMLATLKEYSNNKNLCLIDIFSTGMSVHNGRKIVGIGAGANFQRLMRSCPAAALEHCAISVRHVRKHYGPLNRKSSKAIPACQSTFENVYEYIKKNQSSVCPQLGVSN